MADVIVDTNIFAEVISYYDPRDTYFVIPNGADLDKEKIRLINRIARSNGESGYIVASVFTVIEIANQFDLISGNGNRFSKERFLSLIHQPPDWLLIEQLDINIAYSIINVPKMTSKHERMEHADSIHVATAISRGEGSYMVATDHKIKDLCIRSINIV